jgi:hypothetical protein
VQGARCKKSIGFVESIESAELKGRGMRRKVYGAGLSRKLGSVFIELMGFVGFKKRKPFVSGSPALHRAPCTMHRAPRFICSLPNFRQFSAL